MSEPRTLYALFYEYVPDILERRAPYREEHLAHARAWKEQGRLDSAGALGSPPEGALFIFDVDDPEVIEAFVRADPYVAAGLVTNWRVQQWTVVV